jgi:predicted nucleic acid-binding protein
VKKIDAFWDTSALVLLCIQQGKSRLTQIALRNKSITVWWNTPVEMMSAFCRLLRQDEIGQRDFEAALARLASLKASWIEILPTERVRELAEGLLQTYPLRAADALQLAAALTWTRKQPRKRTFICCDNRLAESALKEGFQAEIL